MFVAHSGAHHSQKNALQIHLKPTWCMRTMNVEYVTRLERLPWLYQQPLDARFPIVCFDERPCFLIGEAGAAQAMQSGKDSREHYAIEKSSTRAPY
jgi:hypothetical protein